jgi:hypothetical protein
VVEANQRLEPIPITYRIGRLLIDSRGGDKWAVVHGGFVLNSEDEFEYEPLPSSRDEAFLARTRFRFDEAVERARAALSPAHEPQAEGGEGDRV